MGNEGEPVSANKRSVLLHLGVSLLEEVVFPLGRENSAHQQGGNSRANLFLDCGVEEREKTGPEPNRVPYPER